MPIPSIEHAAGALRRLVVWGAYATFVASVAASWTTARPASAEVPAGATLGRPMPSEEAPEDPSGGRRGGDSEDGGGEQEGAGPQPSLGPPELEPQPPASRDDEPRLEALRSRNGLTGRLNINSASKEELVLLPGIGDAISSRVIAWRHRHGRFHRVKDLRRVRGIGPKTLETLRPHLTVIGPTTLRPAD